MKKLVCFVICLVSVLSLFGCKKENEVLNKIREKGKIIITTSADYPPFEFMDVSKTGQAQYVGADIELMKYIAKELDVELEILGADFDATLALLATGASDLAISGYTYREDRAENCEFSIAYDSEGSQGVLILASTKDTYKTLSDINKAGNKVAAQNDSLQAGYVGEYLKNTTLSPVTKISDGLTVLENDSKVVAMAIASTTADSIIAQNPGKYIYLEETFPVSEIETQLFVLAKKGETDLIEEINKIIAKMLEENVYKQWLEEAKILAETLGLE